MQTQLIQRPYQSLVAIMNKIFLKSVFWHFVAQVRKRWGRLDGSGEGGDNNSTHTLYRTPCTPVGHLTALHLSHNATLTSQLLQTQLWNIYSMRVFSSMASHTPEAHLVLFLQTLKRKIEKKDYK